VNAQQVCERGPGPRDVGRPLPTTVSFPDQSTRLKQTPGLKPVRSMDSLRNSSKPAWNWVMPWLNAFSVAARS